MPSFLGVRVTFAPSAWAIETFDTPTDDEAIFCDWPFECQARTFPLDILMDVERPLAALPLHVPSHEKSAAKTFEVDTTAATVATALVRKARRFCIFTPSKLPESRRARLSCPEQVVVTNLGDVESGRA